MAVIIQLHAEVFQNGGEGDDVVVPEDGFDFGEAGFGEVGAGVDGAVVHATDFERERVGLGRYNKICAEGAKFGGEAIADVEGDAERRGDYSHA